MCISEKNKLLYVSVTQYGYHTVSVNYCRNLLSRGYKIKFLTVDEGMPIVEPIKNENFEVVYFRPKSRIHKIFGFPFFVLQELESWRPNNIFVVYYRHSILLGLLLKYLKPCYRPILDVRTADISQNVLKRKIMNAFLKLSMSFYSSTTIISKSLAKKLGIKSFHYLPLGVNLSGFHLQDRLFRLKDVLRLVYIGALRQRKLENTLKALILFRKKLSKVKPNLKVEYHIFPKDTRNYISQLQRKIRILHLDDCVTIHPYTPHDKLQRLLVNMHIGVNYIPMVEYFEFQPPTKLFEYLAAGLAVVSTKTVEATSILTPNAGVLVEDDPQSFAEGIWNVYENLTDYDRFNIRKLAEKFDYSFIVDSYFIPVLQSNRVEC